MEAVNKTFTVAQIEAAHTKVKTGADFPAYIQDIIQLGVTSFETFVVDSHTEYYGNNGFKTSSQSQYPDLVIADTSNVDQFKIDIKAHQKGKTDYMTFCNDCAKSGIEKWTVNMAEMTCIYYDNSGNTLLTETIPTPGK